MRIDPLTFEVDPTGGTHPIYVWEAPVNLALGDGPVHGGNDCDRFFDRSPHGCQSGRYLVDI